MDEGLSPRAAEPRRPIDHGGTSPSIGLVGDRSHDALIMQILSTEHFSLLSQRSLVYNEAFTRVGMFLTFLSMSFVALALLSGGMTMDQSFLMVATIVLGFDLIIGITTVVRVRGANTEDLFAVQGMARVRHGYVELAPETEPYFSTGIYDDLPGVLMAYGTVNQRSMRASFIYGLSTSGGMLILVLSLVAGSFGAVASLAIGATGLSPLLIGLAAAAATFAIGVRWSYGTFARNQRNLVARFPRPTDRGLTD